MIIILGGGINPNGQLPTFVLARLKAARTIYKKTPDKIIVSGRFSFLYKKPYPRETEAQAMAAILEQMGISRSQIIIEQRSRDTISNAYYCKQILKRRKKNSAYVITSNFHLARAKYIFTKIFGPKYHFIFISTPVKIAKKFQDHQRQILLKTKKFLTPMKPGDDKWLKNKFFHHPFYQATRPTWVKNFVSQGK